MYSPSSYSSSPSSPSPSDSDGEKGVKGDPFPAGMTLPNSKDKNISAPYPSKKKSKTHSPSASKPLKVPTPILSDDSKLIFTLCELIRKNDLSLLTEHLLSDGIEYKIDFANLGFQILLTAVNMGNLPVIKIFCEEFSHKFSNSINLNQQNGILLHRAIVLKHVEMVKFLISHPFYYVNPLEKSLFFGISPLMLACQHGSESIVRELFHQIKGRKVSGSSQTKIGNKKIPPNYYKNNNKISSPPETQNSNNKSNSENANEKDKENKEKEEHNERDKVQSHNPIPIVPTSDSTSTLTPSPFPLSQDIYSHVNDSSNREKNSFESGFTALHYAASNGHSHIVEILLDNGALIDMWAVSGATPLLLAAESGHWECVKILLTRGANIHNVRRELNCTQWAIYRAEVPMVEYLISYGGHENMELQTKWWGGQSTLSEIIRKEFSANLIEKIDCAIHRGKKLVIQREKRQKLLREIQWEYFPPHDPYSFDSMPPATIRHFPDHIVEIITQYD